MGLRMSCLLLWNYCIIDYCKKVKHERILTHACTTLSIPIILTVFTLEIMALTRDCVLFRN